MFKLNSIPTDIRKKFDDIKNSEDGQINTLAPISVYLELLSVDGLVDTDIVSHIVCLSVLW